MNTTAFLLGVFLIPLTMLTVCHRFRRLTPRQRQSFWGLAIGYGLALVLVLVALLAPPVRWAPEPSLRSFLVYWGLILIPALGSLVGLLPAGLADKSQRQT